MEKKITLVLGSGGARGLAHIGVIKVLEELGVRPQRIIGSSMGALIGALYADGKTALELEQIVYKTSLLGFFQLKFYQGNILDSNKIKAFLKSHVSAKTFEELKIPLTVTALDVNNGKQVKISSGPIEEGVIPSISLPGLLKPFNKNGVFLIDAGIINSLPLELARKGRTVIGVNVSPDLKDVDERSTLTEIILKAVYTTQSIYAKKRRKRKDIEFMVIKPVLGERRILDFRNEKSIIRAGELAAREKLDELKTFLGK